MVLLHTSALSRVIDRIVAHIAFCATFKFHVGKHGSLRNWQPDVVDDVTTEYMNWAWLLSSGVRYKRRSNVHATKSVVAERALVAECPRVLLLLNKPLQCVHEGQPVAQPAR